MTLWDENIDLNNFRSDIISDAIEEYRLDFKNTRYGKWELINPKDFFHKKMDSMGR